MSVAPIVVTGAAGFVGARFVESCNRRGLPVCSVDTPELFETRSEHAGIDFGRIVATAELPRALQRSTLAPRAIVHLGACTDTTELDVAFLRRVNVEYSQELWRQAARLGVPLVYASSAATYGGGEHGWSDDEAGIGRLVPLNPYGASKLEVDRWFLERDRLGERPPAWSGFRFFNVYGFGERHKGPMASVVLQAFDQIRKDGRVRLFKSHRAGVADGHQARDFVFVDDVVDVLHFALEKPIPRGVFNLGTGQARSFLDLAHATFQALGAEPRIEFVDTPEVLRERYQYFTQADVGRLRAAGWNRAFTSLEDGVRRYVERLLAAAGRGTAQRSSSAGGCSSSSRPS